ncbi:MAG: UDP-3-O-acyl-N-acetylglucosamine deacetylase [Pseudomonadota bacterium]
MHTTLSTGVGFSGIGLHGGQRVRMIVRPAEPGNGITFRRTDLQNGVIPASYDLVADTVLCTKLANADGVSVGTVEHLMAALAGMGISDAAVELDGPEVPIMDGSSAPFVAGFMEAGVTVSDVPLTAIRILSPIAARLGDRSAELTPAPRFEMSFRIDFADPAIGVQDKDLTLVNGTFVEELSDCRTFGQLGEVEQLRAAGLARGGNLDNAIVIDEGRILNPEGLRRRDEFVRHKMLDAVGDLALAGAPIIGRYSGDRAGHEITNLLLRQLFATPEAWCWDTLVEGQGPQGFYHTASHHGRIEALAV